MSGWAAVLESLAGPGTWMHPAGSMTAVFWPAAVNLFIRAVPAHLMAYYPFRDRLRFPLWRVLTLLAVLQGIQCLLYGSLIFAGSTGRVTEFGFALVYMAIYFFSVRDDRSKLLFLYLFVMDYVIILRGISLFLEVQFFYAPDMNFTSLKSTGISLAVLAGSAPFMLRFFARARDRVLRTDAPAFWRTAWMVPAFTTAIVMIFTGNLALDQVRTFRFLLVRALLLLSVFVVYSILIRSLDVIREQAALKEQTAVQEHLLYLQKMQQEKLVRYMEETRTARHDLRQHLHILRAYVEKSDREGLKTYLDAYERTLPGDSRKIFTRNFALNAVCAYYGEEAGKYGITYDVSVEFPEQVPVREPEACALLGNLLENAIDACRSQACPDPFIRVRGMCRGNSLVLTVDNSCGQEPVCQHGRFLSTRHPGYGTGTYSVETTARRNGGTAEFSYKEGVFYASVLLYGDVVENS